MPDEEGMSAANTWDQEVEIVQDDDGQGGHAGGGVASIEEIKRPGQHYVVTKSGVTYHGKTFSPESVKPGGVHVTVYSGGQYRVNEGTMTKLHEMNLRRALGTTKVSEVY